MSPHSALKHFQKTNDIFYMRNGMALRKCLTLVLEIHLLEEPEEMAFLTETLKEVCKPV